MKYIISYDMFEVLKNDKKFVNMNGETYQEYLIINLFEKLTKEIIEEIRICKKISDCFYVLNYYDIDYTIINI